MDDMNLFEGNVQNFTFPPYSWKSSFVTFFVWYEVYWERIVLISQKIEQT